MLRDEKDDAMYELNELLDKIRTEFYALLDADEGSAADRDRRRREVYALASELRLMAERA